MKVYTFGFIDWVRCLAWEEDGWGWSTKVPQEIPNFPCKMREQLTICNIQTVCTPGACAGFFTGGGGVDDVGQKLIGA